jgi:TRAP-type C4-dicarboxylate transport system permease small subunit
MLPIVFLPLALAEKNDAHITVEILVQIFRKQLQRILAVCSWIFSAGVFSILFYQTFLDALDKMSVGTFMMEVDWKIPIWASYFFLPVGFGLVIVVLLYKIFATISGAESGLGEKKHEAFDQITIDLEKDPHG